LTDSYKFASRVSPHSEQTGEAQRIAAEYARRSRNVPTDRYLHTAPGALFVKQSTERALATALAKEGMLPLTDRWILDIGCGDGTWLLAFEAFGAERGHLAGVDLLEDRVAHARGRLSGHRAADLRTSDASRLPWRDDSFDIVFQCMMLSSVGDAEMRRAVATEAARVLRPNGRIISYDFWIDNPRNQRVRSVGRRELGRLFPGFEICARRAVIAPPVARVVAPVSWTAAELLQASTLLNSQLIASLRKIDSRS
jgi:SAM-dependent methyltransferase